MNSDKKSVGIKRKQKWKKINLLKFLKLIPPYPTPQAHQRGMGKGAYKQIQLNIFL